jgi:hypothetical protein
LCAANKILEGITVQRREGKRRALEFQFPFDREFDSTDIDVSDSQNEKHDEPRISTLHGITID